MGKLLAAPSSGPSKLTSGRAAECRSNAFHRLLDAHRVNAVNQRKEFFRVSLDAIEQFARQRDPNVTIVRTAEARHYRETLALRAKQSASSPAAPAQVHHLSRSSRLSRLQRERGR